MQELVSPEEIRAEILEFLKSWAKDFNEDNDNLILAPTGTGSKFRVAKDDNPITFDALFDAISVLDSCSLSYELQENEGDNTTWILFTLVYHGGKHFDDFLKASQSYTGLENHLHLIIKAIYHPLWHIVNKYFPGNSVPVLVNPRPESSVTEEVVQVEKYRTWESLCFRSESEIRIARVLDTMHGVLFFPNAKARLGHPQGRENREPDFLVCYKGKWGILEVDGSGYHQAANDHARDRLFKLHGISVIEHFDATECYANPERVVKQFLYLLSQAR
jgi:hypothetical protein